MPSPGRESLADENFGSRIVDFKCKAPSSFNNTALWDLSMQCFLCKMPKSRNASEPYFCSTQLTRSVIPADAITY